MKKLRSFFYLLIASSLTLYGLPRFQHDGFDTLSGGFAIIWTFFAFLVIGSHLYDLLDVKHEPDHNVEPVKQQQKLRASRY